MRISDEKREEVLRSALSEIPAWVKEKERRYKKAESICGACIW